MGPARLRGDPGALSVSGGMATARQRDRGRGCGRAHSSPGVQGVPHRPNGRARGGAPRARRGVLDAARPDEDPPAFCGWAGRGEVAVFEVQEALARTAIRHAGDRAGVRGDSARQGIHRGMGDGEGEVGERGQGLHRIGLRGGGPEREGDMGNDEGTGVVEGGGRRAQAIAGSVREAPGRTVPVLPMLVGELSPARYEPRDIEGAWRLAKMIVASGRAPREVKTRGACFIILGSGAELGLSAMQSLRLIHTFNGTVCPAANLLVALVKRSPVCRYFHMVSGDEKESTWETWRIGEPEAERLTYTIEDAKRQGLSSKDNWTKQPKAMLRARASSALARMVYPDVVWGLHASEEMASDVIDTSAKVVYVPEETAPETPAGAARPAAGGEGGGESRKRGRAREGGAAR